MKLISKIDKDVPMPAKMADTLVWGFDQLDVGDSFELPSDLQDRCRSASGSYSRQHPGIRFAIRKESDHYRCWRIS
jgi:hypothetical protein